MCFFILWNMRGEKSNGEKEEVARTCQIALCRVCWREMCPDHAHWPIFSWRANYRQDAPVYRFKRQAKRKTSRNLPERYPQSWSLQMEDHSQATDGVTGRSTIFPQGHIDTAITTGWQGACGDSQNTDARTYFSGIIEEWWLVMNQSRPSQW